MPTQTLREFPEPPRPQPTGRTLVLFNAQAGAADIQNTISNAAGGKVHDRRDFAGSATALSEALQAGESVVFHRQNVAIITPASNAQAQALAMDDSVQTVRPEFFMFAIHDLQKRYAEWVQQGLLMLVEQSGAAELGAEINLKSLRAIGLSAAGLGDVAVSALPYADDPRVTWGLQATGASGSKYTGRGIKVAVLDTGLDLTHPDFAGRAIVTRSFIPGQEVQDGQGHGTHTAGTIAGPMQSTIGRRYGVAPDVELLVGKVLNNSGVGKEAEILDGMNWAIDEKCVAISMSLGRPTFPNEKPDPAYERTGAAALAENCLIIAASGNESARDSGYIASVSAPANSPSIMSVAAVDPGLGIAPFSCGGVTAGGGEVDISGPGVSIYSSFPQPRQSRLLQGTSMACPHVAGIAALWAESDPGLRGQKLWDALVGAARNLGTPRDFGSGLAQVPGGGQVA